MKELISVICTVKNGENTIGDTLDSIIGQTHTNLEIILINDGSTDSTEEILSLYSQKDNRIAIHDYGSIGRARALNKAIENSNGKFITNVDADDLIHPQKIEIQSEIMQNNPDIFMICSASPIIYDNEIATWDNLDKTNSKIEKINSTILIRNSISHSSVFFNANKLRELGGYDTSLKSQIDYDLWLRAYIQDYKMMLVDLPLARKRIHKNQSFENKNRLKYISNALKLQLRCLIKNPRYAYYLPIPLLLFGFRYLSFIIKRDTE